MVADSAQDMHDVVDLNDFLEYGSDSENGESGDSAKKIDDDVLSPDLFCGVADITGGAEQVDEVNDEDAAEAGDFLGVAPFNYESNEITVASYLKEALEYTDQEASVGIHVLLGSLAI